MSNRLDLIVFGATGFTGKYAALEVHRFAKIGPNLKWGIAGRSLDKLKSIIGELREKTGDDLSEVKIIVADVKDDESLKAMTAQAKVVINCCGPYRFLGEQVVRACVETGTSHVDVSGEPQYMERMQLDYNQAAKAKGVYIVSACGFDSIPCDLGIVHMQQNFKGTLNSVETYLQTVEVGEPLPGATIHYTTFESAVYGLAYWSELKPLRIKLYPERLPALKPKLTPRPSVHKSPIDGKWTVPFLGSDRSVAMRSQRHFYDAEKKRPVQIHAYLSVPSILMVVGMAILGGLFKLLCSFNLGRKILLRNPKFFTAGLISHEGPTEEKQANTHFSITFLGEGWRNTQLESVDSFQEPTDKTMVTKVSGANPGYGITSTALVLSALMILQHSDKMPDVGGVYAPGAAFAKTPLIEELNNHGLKFEIVSINEKTKSNL